MAEEKKDTEQQKKPARKLAARKKSAANTGAGSTASSGGGSRARKPVAKPRKQKPTICRGTNSRMTTIITSSSEMRNSPTLMPARSGMLTTSHGTPRRLAKAVRQLAYVLTRMPYHATAYEPPMPTIENSRTSSRVTPRLIV